MLRHLLYWYKTNNSNNNNNNNNKQNVITCHYCGKKTNMYGKKIWDQQSIKNAYYNIPFYTATRADVC